MDKELKSIGHLKVEDLVPLLQQAFGTRGPEVDLSAASDWFSGVPEGAVPYLNAFRLKYFEYERHVELLDRFFQQHNVTRVGDLGCGVATHLVRLAKLGYQCTGVDLSDESLMLAAQNAQQANVEIDLVKGNIRDVTLDYELDAVISMYVPLSPRGSGDAVQNARRFLRQGGFFAKVHGTPDPNGVPDQASIYDVDVVEDEAFRVARLEHWWIEGEIISWNAYFFVRNSIEGKVYSNDVVIFADHNDMHLTLSHDQKHLHEKCEKLGYSVAAVYPITGSQAAPPWTQENLLILQKLD